MRNNCRGVEVANLPFGYLCRKQKEMENTSDFVKGLFFDPKATAENSIIIITKSGRNFRVRGGEFVTIHGDVVTIPTIDENYTYNNGKRRTRYNYVRLNEIESYSVTKTTDPTKE